MTWLKHTYADQLPENLFSVQSPEPINNPTMAIFNKDLANELGVFEHLADEKRALAYLSGNELVAESSPISQAYAGHQFGNFTKLGDGRAVLLGEIETDQGLFDLQLKGSGATPYSRNGDGRATFYSMLREYLISEAMHALHIPTTRSLAVVSTSDKVYREHVNDGAVLSRVAASHIRVGTFEYARYFGEEGDLENLLNYAIDRHYPDLATHENKALALLEAVMNKQKDLVIDWLRVGFIHGVMNTDNMTISGETIDYGPCAFMNAYHPKTVFSSIDTQGRYAFANQPDMAFFNLRVFANALLPLIDENEEEGKQKAMTVLNEFPKGFQKAYFEMMSDKFGFVNPTRVSDQLIEEGMALLAKYKIDYTNFFTELRLGGTLLDELKQKEDFIAWHLKWDENRVNGASISESYALMAKTNPVVIPRNNLVEEVLNSAVYGDLKPFQKLLNELNTPYDDEATLQIVPANFDASYQTFCGT